MDRTDYLRRDSLHCGVDYGVFDSRRLIESLAITENPDSGRLQLALARGGEHSFEALILARYQMNTQVYFHRIRRVYDHYLAEFMRTWGKENYRTFDDVLMHDDITVLTEIRKEAHGDDECCAWAKRIIGRRHHKPVLESGDFADLRRLKIMGRVRNKLQAHYSDVDFFIDDAAHDVHKLFIPGEQGSSKVEDLYIVEKNGQKKLLAEESGIINKIRKSLRTVRIFADAEAGLLAEISKKAMEIERAEQ